MLHRILIVDDQQTSVEVIKEMLLQCEDFSMITASNAKDACQIALEKQPDLILMDWMLPEVSGMEAVRLLKSENRTKDIPILMITWHNSPAKLKEALEAGAVDYLKKPVEPVELLARVKMAIKERMYQREIINKTKLLEIEKEKVEHYSEELMRSNKALKDFASVISHDLKEPLRKIMFLAKNLQSSSGKKVNGNEQEDINKIIYSSNRMNKLIHNLLVYSKVSSEKVNFTPVNLNEVVANVLTDLETRVIETKSKITVDKLPCIESSEFQMQQLFQNLISNSLKFHRKDVAPDIKIHSKKIINGYWEIRVEDNGTGFDEKYLDIIFKPFQRLHPASEYEGTGIGTAICYKIVQEHGGTITANSQLNKGSVFIIQIPETQTHKEKIQQKELMEN